MANNTPESRANLEGYSSDLFREMIRDRLKSADIFQAEQVADMACSYVTDRYPGSSPLEFYQRLAEVLPQRMPSGKAGEYWADLLGEDKSKSKIAQRVVLLLNVGTVLTAISPFLSPDSEGNDEIAQAAFENVYRSLGKTTAKVQPSLAINRFAQFGVERHQAKKETADMDFYPDIKMSAGSVEDVEQTDYVDSLKAALETQMKRVLLRREAEVLKLRYGLGGEAGLTLAETAPRIGVSVERVRQIEANAIDKLKRGPSKYVLKRFLHDEADFYRPDAVSRTPIVRPEVVDSLRPKVANWDIRSLRYLRDSTIFQLGTFLRVRTVGQLLDLSREDLFEQGFKSRLSEIRKVLYDLHAAIENSSNLASEPEEVSQIERSEPNLSKKEDSEDELFGYSFFIFDREDEEDVDTKAHPSRPAESASLDFNDIRALEAHLGHWPIDVMDLGLPLQEALKRFDIDTIGQLIRMPSGLLLGDLTGQQLIKLWQQFTDLRQAAKTLGGFKPEALSDDRRLILTQRLGNEPVELLKLGDQTNDRLVSLRLLNIRRIAYWTETDFLDVGFNKLEALLILKGLNDLASQL